MFLRAKDGFYKGEVREFPYLVAKSLLDAGRAEKAFAEPDVPVNEIAAERAETDSVRPRRRRGAR